MKNLKKVLALVVALTMVFTTVAFASYPDVDTDADYAGAVELLSALGVLQGDDNGNFNPDNTITRAEFSAVVCRALGLEGSANGAKGATIFTDVAADHWASGYINIASQQGIVNGKGNGIFDPEGNVTFTEAVKMLVVALGYEPMAANRGGWPTGYLTVANSTKLTAGVSATGTDTAALRSTVAQLTANALDIPVMDQTSFGTDTKFEPLDDYGNYKSLLTARDIYVVTGVINSVVEKDDEFEFEFTAFPDDYEFGYESNGDTIDNWLTDSSSIKTWKIGDSNVADYVGQNVDVYLLKEGKSKYTAVIAVPSGIGETLTVSVSDIDWKSNTAVGSSRVKIEYYETKDANKTTTINVEANPRVNVNGVESTVKNLSGFKAKHASITFVENSNDKYFDIIDITVYEYGIVEEVLADKDRIEFVNGSRLTFDPNDDDQIVTIYNAEGAKVELADIEEGDVLAMVVGDDLVDNAPVAARAFKDKLTIYDLGQSSVTGTVEGWYKEDEEFTIDGTDYEYVAGNWVTDEAYNDFIAKDPLGAEGTFYFGMNGKIIGFDGTKGLNGNYGFIIEGAKNPSSFEPHYQLKILTAKEGVVIYDVDTTCEIDGTDVEYASQKLTISKYNNATDAANVADRVIEYDLNKDGEIDEITYVCEYEVVDGDKTPKNFTTVNGTYNVASTSYKVDSKKLESNAIIFDVDNSDADDAKVADVSSLIDDGEYAGITIKIDSDSEYDIFVMTTGDAAFNGEANLFVVESVKTTTYEGEDAKTVTYYANGESNVLTAIFTEDSDSIYGDYEDLNKGSVFVANVADDGFVTDYAVIATMDADNKKFVASNLKAAVRAAFGSDFDAADPKDGVEILIGYVGDIDGNDVTVAGRELDVTGAAAQYAYNTNGSKAKVEVGIWDTTGVDLYNDGKANIVLVKLFEDTVTDIISITDRKTVTSSDVASLIGSSHVADSSNDDAADSSNDGAADSSNDGAADSSNDGAADSSNDGAAN